MAEKHLIVVGGGLAGLMSTIKAAEKGACRFVLSCTSKAFALCLCPRWH